VFRRSGIALQVVVLREISRMHEKGMRVVDLTRSIGPGMSCYPGTPPPGSVSLATIDADGFNEQLLTFSSHTGTHVDLPLHMSDGAPSLDAFGAERFIGRGVALDVACASGGIIPLALIQPSRPLIEGADFVLLHSGWGRYWGTQRYLSGYPVLSSEAAAWLAGFQLKGIGVDMVSVDPSDSEEYPLHNLFLANGTLIVENLVYPDRRLLGTGFQFFCLPLKIEGAEASPVRAVALLD
jgi:arylformamidase